MKDNRNRDYDREKQGREQDRGGDWNRGGQQKQGQGRQDDYNRGQKDQSGQKKHYKGDGCC